jgi:DNA invertase Pin-like site-specific DNA recombinase
MVVCCKLDRLARSSRDLQNILHDLQEIGCRFVSRELERYHDGWS